MTRDAKAAGVMPSREPAEPRAPARSPRGSIAQAPDPMPRSRAVPRRAPIGDADAAPDRPAAPPSSERPRGGPDDILPSAPPFTQETLREQFGDDPELMARLWTIFSRHAVDLQATIARTAAAGQWRELSFAAHTIKGTLATLGAQRASAVATAIGAQAETADARGLPSRIEQLRDEVDKVMAVLARYAPAQAEQDPEGARTERVPSER